MLDFSSNNAGDDLSPAPEPTPANDQVLLDAYSNAVIGVTERSVPPSCASKPGRKYALRVSAAGLAQGSSFRLTAWY